MADHITAAQQEALGRATAILGEHFDNVLLFANHNGVDRDGHNATNYAVRSQGNHFAHLGHVDAWIRAERAKYVAMVVDRPGRPA